MKKKRKRNPAAISIPAQPTTYPAAMSGPIAIDGILYYVCTVPYQQFLDWRYSPLGHSEIDRALRTCASIKLWFPKSNNLILTLKKHNVGTLTSSIIDEAHEQTETQ
jgi:hypothetical protein